MHTDIGGRCALAFVCVYGLTSDEMSHDKIVIVPIKCLVSSSHQNRSTKEGLVLFIRGKYEPKDIVMESNEDITVNEDNLIKDTTQQDTQPLLQSNSITDGSKE